MTKRLFDTLFSGLGLILFAPAFVLLSAVIILVDGFPVFFRQRRIGIHGRPFQIVKFRTMATGRSGTIITASGDTRVTTLGRFLRRYKVDEMPQLWNVLQGDMSLVGPRPEVPEFVDAADEMWKIVLTVRPGITDPASLVYRNEEELLKGVADTESFYRTSILPKKLRLNAMYIQRRSPLKDVCLILLTVTYAFVPFCLGPCRIRRLLASGGDSE